MNDNYQGRDCKIWVAFLNAEDYSIVGDPVLFFRGKCNNSSTTLDKESATITLNVIARASDLYNQKIRRYNSADQKRLFPNDKGLDYVEQAVNKTINWGSANAS
jgi:hypothetical protein